MSDPLNCPYLPWSPGQGGTQALTLLSLLCTQTSVVNYIDQRPAAEKSAQLFFVVFEWKDPFIQKVQDVSIA